MRADVIVKKAFRRILRLVFGFDHWHTSVLEERPYALDIVKYCNARQTRGSVLEIGCGLADILRKTDYERKMGFDIDTKVLEGARFLSFFDAGPKIKFAQFHFPETELKEIVDVLIMVNWIFFFDEETLRRYIEKYFHENVKPGGAIIVDTLRDPHYPNHHNVKTLTSNLPCSISKLGNYIRQREVWAIEKEPLAV
jgi:SAM-dependent methyltransferase